MFTRHFVILFSVFVLRAFACDDKALTYERCVSGNDCLSYSSTVPAICAGRDALNNLSTCNKTTTGISNCLCRQPIAHLCDTNRDCLDGEFCGESIKSGRKVCVGCLLLEDKDPALANAFIPVNKGNTEAKCEKARQPCGHVEDYCSITMPCDQNYECLITVWDAFFGPTDFTCSSESTSCRCNQRATASSSTYGDYAVKKCSLDQQCTKNDVEPREACANHTYSNMLYCTSCDVIRTSHNIIFANLDANEFKCANTTKRDPPMSYVEGPNGRPMDRCQTDSQCTGNSTCVEQKREEEKPTKYLPCGGASSKLCYCRPDTFTSCSKLSDCNRGETCTTIENFNVTEGCVSNAFLDAVSGDGYQVIGKRGHTVDGPKLTYDACKYDWNCKSPRRCTHLADSFLYGHCAGRKSCVCKPLVTPACASDADCEDGEKCATILDARSEPLCISRDALKNSTEYVPVGNVVAAVPTPIDASNSTGYAGEACLSDTDCAAGRFCHHITEFPNNATDHCANNRRNCICKIRIDKLESCTSSMNCTYNEVCTMYEDTFPAFGSCVSARLVDDGGLQGRVELGERPTGPPESVSPVPSPSDPNGEKPCEGENCDNESPSPTAGDRDAVCIDIKLLSSFKRSQLVYQEDIRASVLCDATGSCATPGHMTTFRGVAMSMRTYCREHGPCSRRTAWVNSPRMSVGIRVETRTSGLHMTAFAARYETWLEEAVLKRVIHLGA